MSQICVLLTVPYFKITFSFGRKKKYIGHNFISPFELLNYGFHIQHFEISSTNEKCDLLKMHFLDSVDKIQCNSKNKTNYLFPWTFRIGFSTKLLKLHLLHCLFLNFTYFFH